MKNNNEKQSRLPQNLEKEKKINTGGKPASNEKTNVSPKAPRFPKFSQKLHKKKGTANDAPPSSTGMTQLAFAALIAIEAANPEMTRKQIFENALRLYAGHIAYLPAVELARLNNDTLITLAAVAAMWEKSCKKTLRDIYLSQLDDEEKAMHSAALREEIQSLKDARLIMLRMAGVPISHDLTTNMDIVIGVLMELKEIALKEKKPKVYQSAIDDAILILTAYQPIASMGTTKPAGEPHQDQETQTQSES